MKSITTQRAAALAIAALLLASAAGGALAAAPTVDTETTATSQTTDLTNGGTQTYNSTTSSNISWSADSANSSIEITQDGRVLFSAAPNDYYNNTTADEYYYNVSLADDGSDYGPLEVAANENVTLNVTFTNNTEVSTPDTSNISFTFANGEQTAFIAGTDTDTEVEASAGTLSLSSVTFWKNNSTGAARVSDTTTITNSTDEIQIDVANAKAVDSLGAAAESNGLTLVAFAKANGQTLPVFVGSADASWIDNDEAYVVLDTSGSSATVKNAGALVDSSKQIDVQLVGNEALGFFQTRSLLSSYGAGITEQITTAASAVDVNGNPSYEAVA